MAVHACVCAYMYVPACIHMCDRVCTCVECMLVHVYVSTCVFVCEHCDDEMSVSGEKGGSERKENCLDGLHMVSYLVLTTTMCTVTMGVTTYILQKGLVNSG